MATTNPPVRAVRLAVLGALAFGLAGLGGCSLAPEPAVPAVVGALPEGFAEADTAAAYEPLAWWRTYNDPVLDAIVEEVVERNLDLVEAVARVEQADAQVRATRAGLFPTVQASGEYNRQSQPDNTGFGGVFGGGGQGQRGGSRGGQGEGADTTGMGGGSAADTTDGSQPAAPGRISFSTWSTSLSFSYELDFWGRVRNSTRAALEEYFATVDGVQQARLAVISQALSAYFQILELEQLVELTAEEVDLLAERLALTDQRYLRGLASTFELYSIRQQFRQAQAALPQLESQLIATEGQLGVLVGRYYPAVDSLLAAGSARFDTLTVQLGFDPIPVGLPSTLLLQRPDVRAAQRRLNAARYRIGARRAELFPTLSLTGTAGVQSRDLTSLLRFDQRYTNFIASLTAPLFSGGRIRATIDAAEAAYEAEAAAYARAVLTAFQDVEAALAEYEAARDRYLLLADQLASGVDAVELQLQRFLSGVGDYTGYLDARRNVVNARSALVQAGRGVAAARLAVHRALGGAWVEDDLRAERFEAAATLEAPPGR